MDKVEESGSGYEVLTEESAARWLWRLAVARELMGGSGPNEWSVAEVGDGNLNLVFIVQGPHGALVVKQALPYVRCVGEGWPLSARRAWFEWEGLSEQHRHAAGRVPTPIHYDPALFAFAMSYLSPHIILRRGVVEGREYPRAAEHLGEFLARTLYATSVHKPLPTTHEASAERRRQIEFFDQNHVHTITEELFFVDPFTDCSRNRWNSPHLDDVVLELRGDEELKERAEELKVRFLTHKEALLHGDLHTGSVMVSPDDTRVIDPEFAWFGPIGFDVGLLVGNLLLGFFSQAGHADKEGQSHAGGREAYKLWLLDTIRELWRHFVRRFTALWEADREDSDHERREAEAAVEQVWVDTLSYAGSAMIRRIVGLAHALELDAIEDAAVRAQCERRALALGRELVMVSRRPQSALVTVDALCLRAQAIDRQS